MEKNFNARKMASLDLNKIMFQTFQYFEFETKQESMHRTLTIQGTLAGLRTTMPVEAVRANETQTYPALTKALYCKTVLL